LSATCAGDLNKDSHPPNGRDDTKLLPQASIGDLLLNDTYRDYLDDDGSIIKGREENFKAFAWFVKNILTSVNWEVNDRKAKEVYDEGHPDFVTRVDPPHATRVFCTRRMMIVSLVV